LVAGAAASWVRPALAASRFDVCVYGATPSGIAASYAAAREGARVVLIYGPAAFGGMCANGLGRTDHDSLAVIGGFAKTFFAKASKAAGVPDTIRILPRKASEAFKSMIKEAGVALLPAGLLNQVQRSGTRITALQLDSGEVISAKTFIDASYEGDLLKMSGAPWTYGRESRAQYGESFAGWGAYPVIDAVPDTLKGRHLYGVSAYPDGIKVGDADLRTQAYGFRLCLSNEPANSVRWSKPKFYNPDDFLLDMSRIERNSVFRPGQIYDNYFDANFDTLQLSKYFPTGNQSLRHRLWENHYNHQAGFFYFIATDPRAPKLYQESVNQYGLAADQFVDSGNWPRQLYIRECIRLVGQHVMTQADVKENITKADSIAMGAYSLDCHDTGAYALSDGNVLFEGNLGDDGAVETQPYQISYRSLHAKREACSNLLVSVCVSASHVAYSSMRIEVTYMAMGEAAGCAAALSEGDVTRVDVPTLQNKLRSYGAVLSL